MWCGHTILTGSSLYCPHIHWSALPFDRTYLSVADSLPPQCQQEYDVRGTSCRHEANYLTFSFVVLSCLGSGRARRGWRFIIFEYFNVTPSCLMMSFTAQPLASRNLRWCRFLTGNVSCSNQADNSGEVMRWLHFPAGLTRLNQYLTLAHEHFSFHSPEQTSSVVMCTVVG